MQVTSVVVSAATVLVAAALAVAAPAAAQPSWEMPDVEGEVLQDAWDTVVSTTDGAVVPETATAEGPPFEQFNLTNWEVCSQSPDEGDEISVESPPELEVMRPGAC